MADDAPDTSAPFLDGVTLSTTTLPAPGGDVTVTTHVADPGSGVAGTFELWFTAWQGEDLVQSDHVDAALQAGDAHSGTWSATVPFPAGATGNWDLHVSAIADVAGNLRPAALQGATVLVGYPDPPSELDAVAVGTRHVLHLTWPAANDNGDPLTRYEVWFGATVIGTTTPDDREFDVDFDTLPTWEQGNRFAVKSVNSVGWSIASPANPPTAAPAVAPSPPANVKVIALAHAAAVTWSFPADRWTSAFAGV
ncbi:hypothetical protein, partial [Amnibacterium sp.]|uniref:hypothetical protein n=1 Tax=Amnibacterium sp. TaxID=1872496 RepID=UPI00260F0579